MKKEYFIIELSNIERKIDRVQNIAESVGYHLLREYFPEIPERTKIAKVIAEKELDSKIMPFINLKKEEDRKYLRTDLISDLEILGSLSSLLKTAEIYGVEFE